MWGLIIGGFIAVIAIALYVEGKFSLSPLIAMLVFALVVGFSIANNSSIKKFTANLLKGELSLEKFEQQADQITKEKLEEIKKEIDIQKEQLSDVVTSAKETQEELQQVAEMASPPLLSLKSQRQVKTKDDEHRILLELEATKNAPFGSVVFCAEIMEDTQAIIRGFMILSSGTYGEKMSDDGKTVTQEFIPIGSDLNLTLDVSAPCKVRFTCSHMKESLELNFK